MDMPIDIQHIQQCAPSAPASIVEAIIRTESGFNPLAINVNRGFKLARQPASRKEAEAWARWFLANGHNFDSGLMQINSANLEKLGLTPETVFDVCENIRAGATLFTENYSRASAAFGPGRTSLVSALSAYNTGDFSSGIRNGYVSKVVQNVRAANTDEAEVIPPLVPACKRSRGPKDIGREKSKDDMEGDGKLDPFTVPSGLDGFIGNDLKSWDVEPVSESTSAADDPGPGKLTSQRTEILSLAKRTLNEEQTPADHSVIGGLFTGRLCRDTRSNLRLELPLHCKQLRGNRTCSCLRRPEDNRVAVCRFGASDPHHSRW